jgi:hypothetical protein
MKAAQGPQYTKELEDMMQDLLVSTEATKVSPFRPSSCRERVGRDVEGGDELGALGAGGLGGWGPGGWGLGAGGWGSQFLRGVSLPALVVGATCAVPPPPQITHINPILPLRPPQAPPPSHLDLAPSHFAAS